MFKITPKTNSQRSTPKSMRRLRSLSHSNGEVLMNDYFNLPMISTKSSIENYGQKPNTISVIGEYEYQINHNPQQINNIPIQILVSQGEQGQENSNYDILEKYYQNKATAYQRIQANKLIKERDIREIRLQNFKKKNTHNFYTLNENQNFSKERNLIQRENHFKSNNTYTQLYLFENYDKPQCQQQTIDLEMYFNRIINLKKKLKSVFLCVYSSMVISKKYRQQKQEEKLMISILNMKFQSCQKVINQNGIKFIGKQQQQFVQIVSNKIIHYLNTQTYINECNQNDRLSNPAQNVDWKKLRVQSFSKLIYQNLELLTRECNFPELLKCQLITSLYKTSKQQTSFFVGERCYFYQANRIHLSREQKLAIAMEYLLFQIVIPNLLQIVNNLPTYSQNHKIYTQEILVTIASFLHRQFINRFQNMKKIKNPNGHMVNKKLTLQYLENGLFQTEIDIAQNIGDNNEIIEGLLNQEQLFLIENSKPIWKEQIDALFDKIQSNVQNLINF